MRGLGDLGVGHPTLLVLVVDCVGLLVEPGPNLFFGIITRQAIRRGTFTSVPDLVAAIGTYIDGWNERAHLFIWIKTADASFLLLRRARGQRHTLVIVIGPSLLHLASSQLPGLGWIHC